MKLVDHLGKVVYEFSRGISTLIDLPNGGSVVLIYDINGNEYEDQNVFCFNSNGVICWRNEPRKMTRIFRSPGDLEMREEPKNFIELFFENGEGESRQRRLEYFDGAILAALTVFNNLYEIDMKSGAITFRRNTGSHDHV